MNVLPELAGIRIIGQTPHLPSGLPRGLANLRAPLFLPDSVNAFLFEPQWLYWIAAALFALILIYLARSRRNRQMLLAGAILGGLTAFWIAAAALTDTPGERLYDAHQSLAQAALKKDVDKILFYFDDDFEAPQLGIKIPADAHDQIAARLKNLGIQSNSITGYNSEIHGPRALTRLTLLTQSAAGTVKTTWQLTWMDLPRDDWKITRADLIAINDSPVGPDTVIPANGSD